MKIIIRLLVFISLLLFHILFMFLVIFIGTNKLLDIYHYLLNKLD